MKAQYQMITESVAGSITGGVQTGNRWGNYLSVQVMPILIGLMNGASEGDRAVLYAIRSTLKDTENQGANVAETVDNLWMTYNFTYRPALQSSKIQMTLDQKLYSAKQFADSWG